MNSVPKSKPRRAAMRLLIALAVLFLLLLAFVARAFHVDQRAPSDATLSEATAAPLRYKEVALNFGRGYIGAGWQVYFNEPDASGDRGKYLNGIDSALAAAIDEAKSTLDVAAFELNNEAIHAAIALAHERGVAVRIVTDDKHGLNDARDSHLRDLARAGVPLVDDSRAGLMHDKFVIIDQRKVWTGSWNYSVNGTYRNNNNALVLESVAAAAAYQAEFDEMFERGEFGSRSRDDGVVSFDLGSGEASVLFGAEGNELGALTAEIAKAGRSIRFMSFVFSLEELAEAMLRQAARADVSLQGIFENRNSKASWSQLPALHCAGAAVRQDGNRYAMHHKVIIIDADTVITGSFNFSRAAAERNDENIVILRDAAIAGLYLEEWRRVWDSAQELAPDEVDCN